MLVRIPSQLYALFPSCWFSCQHIGDESVKGEAAAVYTEVNQESGVSGKVWISKKGASR